MQNLYVSNEAEANWLDSAKSQLASTVKAHLWSDGAFTPSDTDTLSTFTGKEASYSGYAEQTLTLDTVVQGGDGRAYTLTGDITFPFAVSGTQAVHGIFFTSSGDTKLLGATKFTAAVTVSSSVRPDTYQQKFTLRQEPM